MRRSPISEDGALGVAFQVCRALQFACLIATLGMTAQLVSKTVNDIQQPPAPLISILCITCFAILYVIITYLLYFDNQLQKHYTTASDTLFFIALTITSAIVGNPLPDLSCKAISAVTAPVFDSANTFTDTGSNQNPPSATTTATVVATGTAAAYLQPESGTVSHLRPRSTVYTQTADYSLWVGSTERTCDMMKAVWGLAIALTILFAFSTLCLALLWKKKRIMKEKNVRAFEA